KKRIGNTTHWGMGIRCAPAHNLRIEGLGRFHVYRRQFVPNEAAARIAHVCLSVEASSETAAAALELLALGSSCKRQLKEAMELPGQRKIGWGTRIRT